jgi:hypothetical protein
MAGYSFGADGAISNDPDRAPITALSTVYASSRRHQRIASALPHTNSLRRVVLPSDAGITNDVGWVFRHFTLLPLSAGQRLIQMRELAVGGRTAMLSASQTDRTSNEASIELELSFWGGARRSKVDGPPSAALPDRV